MKKQRSIKSSLSSSKQKGKQHEVTQIPRSQRITRWMSVSFVLILGTLLVLIALDVRFGQGFFAYRYTPVRNMRTVRAAPVLLIAGMLGGAIWSLSHGVRQSRGWRWAGRGLLVGALLLATWWLWWGPPQQMEQHAFNLRSFSTDGAFVTEAEGVASLPEYLRGFQQRLARTPKEMGGTRVLSNPPGMTAFACGVIRAWPNDPDGWYERWLRERRGVPAEGLHITANSLKVAMALCAIWMLAAASAYFLGRVFLSPTGAVVFAVIACFNPSTVHFVPGKDPAQLLTINLMLLGWLAAWQDRRAVGWGAFVGGVVLAIGTTVGLIHIWVALAALAATMWDAIARRDRKFWTRLMVNTIAAGAGVMAVLLVAYVAIGWNIPGQLIAVSRRFESLQETFTRNRAIWFAIGLPSSLLFTSPGFWALVGMRLKHSRMGMGARLAACTGGVMMLTYLMGVTYELPRLWVAFLPPLVLGLAMELPLMKFPARHWTVTRALVVIVAVQVIFTGAHWTLLDVRESEYRLLTKRFYR